MEPIQQSVMQAVRR